MFAPIISQPPTLEVRKFQALLQIQASTFTKNKRLCVLKQFFSLWRWFLQPLGPPSTPVSSCSSRYLQRLGIKMKTQEPHMWRKTSKSNEVWPKVACPGYRGTGYDAIRGGCSSSGRKYHSVAVVESYMRCQMHKNPVCGVGNLGMGCLLPEQGCRFVLWQIPSIY